MDPPPPRTESNGRLPRAAAATRELPLRLLVLTRWNLPELSAAALPKNPKGHNGGARCSNRDATDPDHPWPKHRDPVRLRGTSAGSWEVISTPL